MQLDEPIVLEHVEIRPGIYHVTSESAFDLAMTFLKTQEYYESDNPNVRGKKFDLLEYMRWYTKKSQRTSFSYASDWGGFNVPSGMIARAIYPLKDDANIYDKAMAELAEEIAQKHGVFYLIGTMNNNSQIAAMLDQRSSLYDGGVLNHEMAHAFYYIKKDYKNAVDEIIASMSDVTKKRIYKELERLGYAEHVWNDELQAYMVSGIEELNGLISVKAVQKKFRKIFNNTIIGGKP